MSHTQCALLLELYVDCKQFRRWIFEGMGLYTASQTKIHTHHIWGGTQRMDLPSNLLAVCAAVHKWLHDFPTCGKVAAMWARSHQPGFSWGELDEASGKSARGWLECQEDLPQPYARYREELLAHE